jgi:hypothetical protein
MLDQRGSSSNPLAQVLSDLTREAQLPAATLSSKDGLLIASSTINGDSPTKQSAVVAKLAEAANLVRSQLTIGTPSEFSFFAEDGKRPRNDPSHCDSKPRPALPPRNQPGYRSAAQRLAARLKEVGDEG